MGAWYNDFEPYVCDWMRNLIAAGYIAPGVVDGRSVKELAPEDVRGAGQRHFFAGVGAWSYALRLAGVPDDFSIWSASLPCQPFSQAGRGKGFDDERHLWPDFFKLVKECRPQCLVGEQSSSPDGLKWLDAVQADLDSIGYAVGYTVLTSACVGAPHIRHRIYWVAYSKEFRWPEGWNARPRDGLDEAWLEFERHGDARQLADTVRARWSERRTEPGDGSSAGSGGADELADADRQRLEGERLLVRERGPLENLPEAARSGEVDALADTGRIDQPQEQTGDSELGEQRAAFGRWPEQRTGSGAGSGDGDGFDSARATRPGDAHDTRAARHPDDRLGDAARLGRRQDRLHVAGNRTADGAGAPTEHRDAGAADGVGDAGRARGGRNPGAVPGAQSEGGGGLSTGHLDHQPVDAGAARELGDAGRARLPEQRGEPRVARAAGGDDAGQAVLRAGPPTRGFWWDVEWHFCRDGKYRSTEPGVEPLAHGVAGRVGQIKAYGNAINPLCAATFIRAFMEATQHL